MPARQDQARSLHDNAETAAIFLRGMHSFADLDPVSKLSFSAFFNRLINIFEGMYFSHCQGILTGSSWRAVERTMNDLIAYPGVQQWWEVRRHWHTEEFSRVVDEIIARGDRPKAFSAFNLREIVGPTTDKRMIAPSDVKSPQISQIYADCCFSDPDLTVPINL